MKKIKKLFSSKKGGSETSSHRGSLGGRNGSIISLSGSPLQYDVKMKDLDKIHKAVLNNDEAKVNQLAPKYVNARDKEDRTPLHLACATGNAIIVEKLLSWKALVNVPDRENKTPLFKAIESGNESCAKILIQAKADLKVLDREGNSCLHYLCKHNALNLLPMVLPKLTTQDIDKKNKLGKNSLHIAIEQSNKNSVELLLRRKAGVDVVDNKGLTPLMLACMVGSNDIVSLLLTYDADANARDPNGYTAIDHAKKVGHVECVQEIESFINGDGDDDDDDEDGDGDGDDDKGDDGIGGDDVGGDDDGKSNDVNKEIDETGDKNVDDDKIDEDGEDDGDDDDVIVGIKDDVLEENGDGDKISMKLKTNDEAVVTTAVAAVTAAANEDEDDDDDEEEKDDDDKDDIINTDNVKENEDDVKHVNNDNLKNDKDVPGDEVDDSWEDSDGIDMKLDKQKPSATIGSVFNDAVIREASRKSSAILPFNSIDKHNDDDDDDDDDVDNNKVHDDDDDGGDDDDKEDPHAKPLPTFATQYFGIHVKSPSPVHSNANKSPPNKLDSKEEGSNLLKNQVQMMSQIGMSPATTSDNNNPNTNFKIPENANDNFSASNKTKVAKKNADDEDDSWDSTSEDYSKVNRNTGKMIAAQKVPDGTKNNPHNMFSMSEITYPIISEKFQQLSAMQMYEDSDDHDQDFVNESNKHPQASLPSSQQPHSLKSSTAKSDLLTLPKPTHDVMKSISSFDSSDEDEEDDGISKMPTMQNKVSQGQHDNRRPSLIENQIGSMQSMTLMEKENKNIKKQSMMIESWDSSSEDVTSTTAQSKQEVTIAGQDKRKMSTNFIPSIINQASSVLRRRKSSSVSPMNSNIELNMKAELDNLHTDYDDLDNKLQQTSQRVDELLKQLCDANQRANILQEEVQQLKTANEKLTSEKTELMQIRTQYEKELSDTKLLLSSKENSHDEQMNIEKQSLDDQIHKLTNENKVLNEINNDMKDKLTSYEDEMKELKMRHNDETSSLKSELNDAMMKMKMKNGEVIKCQEDITDLKNKLSLQMKEHESITQSYKHLQNNLKIKLEKSEYAGDVKVDDDDDDEFDGGFNVGGVGGVGGSGVKKELDKLDHILKSKTETCQMHMKQLAEQTATITKLQLENQLLNKTMDVHSNEVIHLKKEVDVTKQHLDAKVQELYKEKEINAVLKSDNVILRMEITKAQKETEMMKMRRDSATSFETNNIKMEYEQKVSLLEATNNNLSENVKKLRGELNEGKSRHEDEMKTLKEERDELFKKLLSSQAEHKKENISKTFLESELNDLKKDVSLLKVKLAEEQKKKQSLELQLFSMKDQIESSKYNATNVEQKLSEHQGSLVSMEQENHSLKNQLHQMELENVKLDANLIMEKQTNERLIEELRDMKNKHSEMQKVHSDFKKTNMKLQHKIQDLSCAQNEASIEAENNRELWENEVKSKSKLGLRVSFMDLYHLDLENRNLLNKLTQEQLKLRRSLEKKQDVGSELQMEREKSELLSQKLNEMKQHMKSSKKKKFYTNNPKYMINTTRKSNKQNYPSAAALHKNVIWDKETRRGVELMKNEIEKRTQAEFMQKLNQVNHFLEEHSIIRQQNERKRIDNMNWMKQNLQQIISNPLDGNIGVMEPNIISKSDELKLCLEDLKKSESILRNRLSLNNVTSVKSAENFNLFPTQPYETKGYTTEEILQQLEKSITNYNRTL